MAFILEKSLGKSYPWNLGLEALGGGGGFPGQSFPSIKVYEVSKTFVFGVQRLLMALERIETALIFTTCFHKQEIPTLSNCPLGRGEHSVKICDSQVPGTVLYFE